MAARRYIWHHRLHEAWAGERLYFWRLSFFPTYDEKRISPAIVEILRDHDVSSYAIYETYGVYDVVLRVWLAAEVSPEEFENALSEKLTPLHLDVSDSFSVGRVLRHWPWLDTEQRLESGDSELLRTPYSAQRLSQLNEIASGSAECAEENEPLRSALSDEALARCSPGDGIKFIVVVTSSSQLATITARSTLRDQLLDILDRAEAESGVSEASLYEGSGFGQFVLLGRLDPARFEDLRTQIIDQVNKAGTGAFFRARPYTFIATGAAESPSPRFVDIMPTEAESERDPRPIEGLLQQEESETLEMKASAFVNVRRWLQTGKATAEDAVTNEGVLKAIVGMLNDRGGTVIVGVLEKNRPEVEGAAKERLVDSPMIGNYVCLGIKLDYQGLDWDRYALKLQQVILERIDPSPVGLVTVSKVDLDNKELCVLSVQRTEREWFYLRPSKQGPPIFYVRLGNSTRPYSGPLADAYKASQPRG